MADLIISQPMTFTVDVKTGLVERPQRESLMRGDKYANRIIVELVDGSEPFDITGVTVKGEFCKPPNGDAINLTGEAKGNVAEVQLTDQCYTAGGHYEARVILVLGEVERTVLFISGDVLKSGSGNEAGEEPGGEPGGGSTGSGLPAGGTAGQVLVKVSSANGAAIWKTLTAEDVGARPDTWTPTAEETGALPKDGTSKDSEKLGGQMPEHYASAESVSQLSEQKADKAGWTPNKLIGTDAEGKLVTQDLPEGGGGDAETLGGVAAAEYARKILISDEYSGSKTYNSGDYCIYENALHKCKQDNVMGIEPTDTTYWKKVTIADEITANERLRQLDSITVDDTNVPISNITQLLTRACSVIAKKKSAAGITNQRKNGLFSCSMADGTHTGSYYSHVGDGVYSFKLGGVSSPSVRVYFTTDAGATWSQS